MMYLFFYLCYLPKKFFGEPNVCWLWENDFFDAKTKMTKKIWIWKLFNKKFWKKNFSSKQFPPFFSYIPVYVSFFKLMIFLFAWNTTEVSNLLQGHTFSFCLLPLNSKTCHKDSPVQDSDIKNFHYWKSTKHGMSYRICLL